LALKINHLKI